MIFAFYLVVPGPEHPDVERIGGAYVNCWLRVGSFAEAKRLAEKNLRDHHWKILELEEIWRIPRGYFHTEHDGRAYYEQALIDREVYAFHQWPKYPVYCVDFEAVPMRTNAQFPKGAHANVKYWVLNSKVSSKTDEYDDFWCKEAHVRKAIALGKRAVKGEKWRVTVVGEGRPVNFRSYPRDPLLTQYCEEAEEYGECLSFWHDAGPSKNGPDANGGRDTYFLIPDPGNMETGSHHSAFNRFWGLAGDRP